MIRRILKAISVIFLILVSAGAAYLYLAPPKLFLVGTNYAAKIVCSNVFIAGRDGAEVLAIDVQAPGHPLLKQVSIHVDHKAQTVDARLFRFFAPARSQHRAGLGCTNIHNSTLSPSTLDHMLARQDDPLGWPAPNVATGSTEAPGIQKLLQDPALQGPGFRAAVAVHKGALIGEAYGDGFTATTPLLGWSMTKTVTAALIGTLVKDGHMSLTDNLTPVFPDWATDDRAGITLADMMAMRSSLDWNEDYGNVSDVTQMLYLQDDMTGFAASRPTVAGVGEVFNYSSGTSTMLSRTWQRNAPGDGLRYPQQALFGPLGMTSAIMETDATDIFVGSSYMYATARDWARFGLLLQQQGVWNGEQVLPDGFVDWMFTPVDVSDGRYANGQIWRETSGGYPPYQDAVWLQGHDGQSIAIFPKHELVVVRLGLTPSKLGYSALPLSQAIIAALPP